ncbi:MAG: TIGR02281 family clan AA aspartic protease [Phycisphaerae bacterium]|nr:retropepsin-like aspartic protease [Tepidisphaeraceae bacterium]
MSRFGMKSSVGSVARRWVVTLAVLGATPVWAEDKPVAGGAAVAAPAKPEEVMAAKGLVKQAALWLTKDDAALGEDLRKFRLAKLAFDADTKKRVETEAKIKQAKSAVAQWEYQYRALNEKLSKGIADAFQHNKAVAEVNALASKIKEGEDFVKEREGEMGKFNASREAYITALVELSDKMEAAAKAYEALAKDDEVTKALVVINDKARPKNKLGPSADLTQNVALIKRQRGDVNSAIVQVKYEANTPHVDVTLNGKVTRSMILDSGASTIALTAASAKEIGLVPGPADPLIRMQLADGRLYDARRMMIKSVKVGQFLIEDVECAVLPATLVAADDLLGGSFLKHFVYKLDPDAKELHLSQVKKK